MGVNTDLDETNKTEYLPNKCRITRPPPPKPAANPLQFIKVGPCPLYKKAQEQIKKVEEVKVTRQEVMEELEDWQHNLDNWKSTRRRRQEHIIERVEEVKKMGMEEHERSRRKNKTFNEILEERNKGRFSFNLQFDDSNDLSEYGIGTSSSKNSTQNPSTDDNTSDDNTPSTSYKYDESNNNMSEATNSDEAAGMARQTYVSEMTLTTSPQKKFTDETNLNLQSYESKLDFEENAKFEDNLRFVPVETVVNKPDILQTSHPPEKSDNEYTYEGAIQDYRTRIRSKININESIFNKGAEGLKSKEFVEVQGLLPKGSVIKKKEMFKSPGNVEIGAYETRRVSEDLTNIQSIKQRLESLERCIDQTAKNAEKLSNVKLRIDAKNDEDYYLNGMEQSNVYKPNQSDSSESKIKVFESNDSISYNNRDDGNDNLLTEKINLLDMMYTKPDEYTPTHYPQSSSSTDIMAMSSDRDDSGIHTSDVSCSVSQSDEAFDDDIMLKPKEQIKENLNYNKIQYRTENYPTDIKITSNFILNEINFASTDTNETCSITESCSVNEGSSVNETCSINETGSVNEMSSVNEGSINENYECYQSKHETFEPNQYTDKLYSLEFKEDIFRPTKLQPPSEKPPLPPPEVIDGPPNENLAKPIPKRTPMKSFLGLDRSGEQETIITHEDEIAKKEREIIEMVEDEERREKHFPKPVQVSAVSSSFYLTEEIFNEPLNYNVGGEQDSEVLKVEHELLQLEKEEMKRQQENLLYRERSAKLKQMEYLGGGGGGGLGYGATSKYCKSMPEIHHTVNKTLAEYPVRPVIEMRTKLPTGQRKSMPDLQRYLQNSGTRSGIPVKTILDGNNKDKMHRQYGVKPRYSNENWIQPKQNPEVKNYNQHWLFQEAELRRIADQNRGLHEKQSLLKPALPVPPPAPPKYTNKIIIDRIQSSSNQMHELYNKKPYTQHSLGHALPLPYPMGHGDDNQDVILSVSGKKKCSYCGNELGRGAAMIIESLSLFYHMECFKCCVCHVQLGDGLMGTDVRVRSQKLHCHNCYSSDDGIKFSCV